MLSREDRILSELLVARGLIARDLVEGWAKARTTNGPSLAEIAIDSGEIRKDLAEQVVSEARAIDAALAPELPEGIRLGEFRLIREIGRGGMGIVYEAEQESLGRHVAIKVLPAGAALDERLAIRFLREARVTSQLQHPGIVPVFASGRAEGVLYFAMELVEGRSLAELAAEGPMEPERAAGVIAQVARALDHAHRADLVHRDVKPENILLTADGRARLTDFGLVHEILSGGFTLPRHVLGTPAYIAPEQALGERVDRRSDIYGLGAVLYTLVHGKPPYAGEVPSAILFRVLSGPPPSLTSVHSGLPPAVVAICDRAMARDPENRYASAADMAEDLEAFLRGESPAPAPPIAATSPPRPRAALAVVSAVAIVVACLAIAWLVIPRGMRSPPSVALPPAATFTLVSATPGSKASPSLSPDGRLLAFNSRTPTSWQTFLVDLTSRDVTRVDGAGANPAFSPDGRSLAAECYGGVAIVDLETRAIRQLSAPSGSYSWSPDGHEIVVTDRGSATGISIGRLWAVDVASSRARVIRSIDARELAYSPHGTRIAFVSRSGGRSDVWTISPDGRDAARLTDDDASDWSPAWSADGRHLFFGSDRGGTPGLYRVAMDEASGKAAGSPERALREVFPVAFQVTIAAGGRRMAIVNSGEARGRIFRFPFDPSSGMLSALPEALARHPAPALSPQPSPDGRFLIYTALSPDEDLALVNVDGSDDPRLITNDAFKDRAPRWSPDGKRIAFHSDRSGAMEIWTVRPDGSELRRITETTNGNAVFPVWSPDGTRLAYSVEGVGAYVISFKNGGGTSPSEALHRQAADPAFEPWSWSPDGATLAGSAAGLVLYSMQDGSYRRLTDFGEKPVWLGDGRRLLFTRDRAIWTIDRDGANARELYSAAPCGLPPSLGVSADGRSIYASLTASNDELWIADLPE